MTQLHATAPYDIDDALRESEARFRTLFEHAPFSVQLLASDGGTLQVNKAWEALWLNEDSEGLRQYVLSGEYNVLTDPQLQKKGITPYLQRAFAGEPVAIPPIYYDPAEIGRRGRPRWVKAHAHPLHDRDGNLREVMLIHDDITDRMEADYALRKSEERLKEGLQAGRMVVWEWDLKTQRIEYSPNAKEVMGYNSTDVNDGWSHVHPDDAKPLRAAMDKAMKEGGRFQMLSRRIRPDNGNIVWIENRGSILYDDEGQPMAVRGINIDVTERVHAESELKEASRRKDEFLAMLAHELRNPLAPISTAAQLLNLSATDEKMVRHAGEVISRQVRHMTELVDDLLDVSRVTRGLVTLDMETLEVEAVINGAVEQVRPLLEARGHALSTSVEKMGRDRPGRDRPGRDGQVLLVRADRTRMIQVLANLLSNAAKYTPPGGRITVQAQLEGAHVAVSVTDNGSGIDAGLLPHVFDLFTQAERTPDRSQGGLGIGLALVKSIMALHGGRVEAYSEGLGKGSRFTLRLPLATGGVVPRDQAAQGHTRPVTPTRVMIVDDNLDAAHSLALLLESQGHEVSVLADGASALAASRQHAPRVFILDIGLPDMSGYELARHLRAAPATREATLIALTGYGQEHDRKQSQAAGFRHHFVKPVDEAQLARVLSEHAGEGS